MGFLCKFVKIDSYTVDRRDGMLAIAIIIVLYIYLIAPRVWRKPDCSKFLKQNYAHRGFHNKEVGRPENSMSAFRMAVELNYGIELDVQLTKDNQVVVFHDYDLKRVCGEDKRVCELTYKEIKKYRLCDTNEHIPLLSEVLREVNGKVPLLVELKCKNMKDKIAAETDHILKDYSGFYVIQSFHPVVLFWYRRNHPDVIRGQLAESRVWKNVLWTIVLFLHQHLVFNVFARPDFISYNFKHQKELSLNICKYLFGCPLIAWTVRSKEQFKKCKKRFNSIIFELFYL